MSGRASRKGLSPLLAIIIGLVVTIVAGILLAQLYFSYAATLSARPAANVEYVDLVADGTDVLAINIKNVGNVRITGLSVTDTDCNGETVDVPPGGTVGLTCNLTNNDVNPGDVWSSTITVTFADNSTQVYAISVRARSA
ncbi:MAG: hypothetical protein QXX29_05180 [Nitrososphaerota archaeon]